MTLISDSVYRRLNPKPKTVKSIRLHTAGKNLDMIGFVVGPVTLKLGSKTFSEFIYVAPIEDDMLLGINFLSKQGINLNLKESVLSLGSEKIKMTSDISRKDPTVAKVSILKRRVIPPNSMTHVVCQLDKPLDQFILEPLSNERVAIPRSLHCSGQQNPEICIINLSDNFITLKKGRTIGEASVAHEVKPMPDELSRHSSYACAMTKSEKSEKEETLVPEHLLDMFNNSKKHLNPKETAKLANLLVEFQDVFAQSDFDLGNFTEITHTIDTGNAKPIKQNMRRTPLCFVQEEEAHLKKMLDAKVIRPSQSDWASPPVLIRKRDGTVRWCIDFRALNNVTVKDVFPLPIIEECLDTLSGNVWFSKLDANSAYWQIPLAEEDMKKTAFTTKYGLFEFTKLAFGLCNAPASFSRAINLVLRGLNWNIVLAFLDDILVLGKNFEDHLENLKNVLDRLRRYKLKLKPRKCELFQTKVEFLGRTVSGQGLEVGNSAVQTIQDWSEPRSTKDVERFLGFANYHRNFIKNFAELSVPLYKLTGKGPFIWEEDQKQAFHTLKAAFTSIPMLSLPTPEDLFILDTDASEFAIGAELSQVQNGEERVISFGSFALSPEQKRYCTTRKELLAIIRFTRQYRHYLLGRHFIIRTDHSSLTWLLNFKNPQGQLARWLEELSQYDMKVQHRPGVKHCNADALSRIPEPCHCENYKLGFDLSQLPCGGCHYCTRAHKNWSQFAKDIDDVRPLAAGGEFKVNEVVCDDTETCLLNQNMSLFQDAFSEIDFQDFGETESVPSDGLNQEGTQFSHFVLTECRPVGESNFDAVTVSALTGAPASSLGYWGHNRDALVKSQTEDPTLKMILEWCKNKTEPSRNSIKRASKAEKYFWINKNLFFLEDNVLWKKNLENEDRVLVVPKPLQTEIIRLEHDLPSSGHQGVERTKERIRYKYFWYGLGRDVRKFVISCSVCNQSKKPTRKNRSPLILHQAGSPMERIHIDFIGPLPKTSKGNEHILMVVDQFTKWVECLPLPSQTAESTACALVNEFFSRFGYPFEIFSDQGRNFESELFAKLCEMMQIHKTRTTPYRPSGNGQVERFNRTLLDAVRCFVQKNPTSWDIFLPQIAGALRSSVNRQTGFTPNRLMLGRETNQAADLMYKLPKSQNTSADDYLSKLEEAISAAHSMAREKLKTSQERMKRDYDLHVLERSFVTGDLVYVLCQDSNKGKGKKLMPQWKGPGIIVVKFTPSLFRVKLRNTMITCHHDKLKKCTDRDVPTWIQRFRSNSASLGTSDSSPDTDRQDLFCICRKPCKGEFMIQCDGCAEWFHGRCVNITSHDALSLDEFFCSACDS